MNERICDKYKGFCQHSLLLPLLQVRKLKFEELCLGSHSQESVNFRWRGKLLTWMSGCNGECHLQIDTCHLSLQGSNYELLRLLSTPSERSPEWRSGMRPSVLWANWQNRSSDRYFQEKILWAQFLHLFISRKALKSFMVMSTPWDCSNLYETSRKLQKNMCLVACIPLHQSHVYILTFPHSSLEQYLSAIWNAVSRDIVLILLQIKLNSPLSHFAFFFSWQESVTGLDKAKMVENCL